MSLPLAIQEDIQKALEEENESGCDSDSSEGSGSSSDSSSFAKQIHDEGDSKAAAASGAKRKAKSKAKPSQLAPPTKKIKAEDSQKGQATRKTEKEQARFEVSMVTYQKASEVLREVTPSAIWRSLVRSVEIERRVSKAYGIIDELSRMQSNMKLEDDQVIRSRNLENELGQLVAWINALKEASRIVRTSEAKQLSEEIKGQNFVNLFKKCANELFADTTTLSDMVHVICKKLFEATWQQSHALYCPLYQLQPLSHPISVIAS